MRSSDFDILIIPGLGGSGSGHWQSRWEAKLSTARRVEQDNWQNPRLEYWRDRIVAAVESARRPVLLVAHSLGVTAVAHAAPELQDRALERAERALAWLNPPQTAFDPVEAGKILDRVLALRA